MPIHKKIIHNLQRHKTSVIAHVRKHHKKYIFGAGVALGVTIVKILAITGLFMGIHWGVGQSQAADEEVRIYKQIAVFDRLDDFMHQKFNEISPIHDPIREEHDKKYLALDAEYHKAKNLTEKYRAAQNLLLLALEGKEILNKLGYAKPEDNVTFDQLVIEFYAIK